MKSIKELKKEKPLTKEETIAKFKKDALEERGYELSDREAEQEYEFINLLAEIFVDYVMREAEKLNKEKQSSLK